jgi:Flp pilus assembly protein TadD
MARLAVSLDPASPQARLHLAGALHLLGEHREELAALDGALALAPAYREARISRALVRCELERSEGCEAELVTLVRQGLLPGPDGPIALVEAALRRGDLDTAGARLETLSAVRPDDPRVAQLTAVLARRRGQDHPSPTSERSPP